MVCPKQTNAGAVTVNVGMPFTVTSDTADAVQLPIPPVTVYEALTVGLATTTDPVVVLNSGAAFQV